VLPVFAPSVIPVVAVLVFLFCPGTSKRPKPFDPEDERQIADMRRSGAVEGMAGGATPSDMSNKMANTLLASTRLQKTYTPVNVASVIRFDQARARGRRGQKPAKKCHEA
jgi:hypothetical protein